MAEGNTTKPEAGVIPRIRRWVARGFLLFLFGLGLWALYVEPSSVRVQEYDLTIHTWPKPLHGLRIGILADLHVGSPYHGEEMLRNIVQLTNKAACDIVLIPGDLVIHGVVGGQFVAPEVSADILKDLSAPLGVYAVLGNHDWWFDGKRVQAALEQSGIPVLEDRSVRISKGEESFWLVGVSDYWEGPHDVIKALADVPQGQPLLLFTHNPDLFPEIPSSVSLTVADHTHGGQVYLPILGRLIVLSRYGQRFAIGHIVERGQHLFVTPGLGTSILPVRFLVPPEISVLNLHSSLE